MRQDEQIIQHGIPIHRTGYTVKTSEVTTSRPGKTLVKRRPVDRINKYLLIQAFSADHELLYERSLRSSGPKRWPLLALRARMYAEEAESTAYWVTQLDSLPFIGKALANFVKHTRSPQLDRSLQRRGKPSIIDTRDAVQRVHELAKNGAKNHKERSIDLPMPADRTAVVAGYVSNEKGEGTHQHNVRTMLSILEGQFRVFAWDGKQWTGSVYGPHTFINVDAYTPHRIEPHNPNHPNALNVILVETLESVSFKEGDEYNKPIPSWIPEIPQSLLGITTAQTPPSIMSQV